VNVLVALAWPNHIHHARARRWLDTVHAGGWATCPLTESGFLRVSSNTRVVPDARSPGEVRTLLRSMRTIPGHRFWEDDVSPAVDPHGIFARVVGYRQVTDAHLLTLALARDGRLATFDRGLLELAPEEARPAVAMVP